MELNLIEATKLLILAVSDHIGSGDKAHTIADAEHAGFMSEDLYAKVIQSVGDRQLLPTNTDVLTLKAGRYWGYQLKNVVDNSTAIYMVTVDFLENQEMKVIQILESATGRKFNYSIHRNDQQSIPTGWREEKQVVTLWQGTTATVGQQLKFTDNFTKFREVKVYVTVPGGAKEAKTFDRSAICYNTQNVWNSGSPTISHYEMNLVGITDNTGYMIESNRRIDQATSGQLTEVTDAPLQITKIEGVI